MNKLRLRRLVSRSQQYEEDWPAWHGTPLAKFCAHFNAILAAEPDAQIQIFCAPEHHTVCAEIIVEVAREESDEECARRMAVEAARSAAAAAVHAARMEFEERNMLEFLRAKYEGASGPVTLLPDGEGRILCPRCGLAPAQRVNFSSMNTVWRCDSCAIYGDVAAAFGPKTVLPRPQK